MTKKKTKIKRNIKLSTRLHRIANFTSKSFNKAYIDYKHTRKIKEKKELKLKEIQINKDYEKIKEKEKEQRLKENDQIRKEDELKLKFQEQKLKQEQQERKQEEQRIKDREQKLKDEEQRLQEKEQKLKNEEQIRKQEELKQKEDQLKLKEKELRKKDKEVWKKNNFEFKVFHIPGHTSGHICFNFYKEKILFTGDTLFSLGCGRIFEGTYQQMFNSLNLIKSFSYDTKIYCGHEYTLKNSSFCIAYDKNNFKLKEKIISIKENLKKGLPTIPSTLKEELETNIFLRCNSLENFSKLRELKDNF